MPKVSVVIPTMKGREAMLAKLRSTIPADCETIVVADEDILLAAKRNKGARQAKGEYLLFIDDDNYVKESSTWKMVEDFEETIGVMGMTACYDDKKMIVADGGSWRNQISGFTWGARTNGRVHEQNIYVRDNNGIAHEVNIYPHSYEVDEVANAFMIRRDVFYAVGGFDELNFPIDMDEADICKRIKDMGYRIVMHPQAIVYHKSQTYSHIPNFRRPLNAYFHGRNRILYSRKFNHGLRLCLHLVLFVPVFVCFYSASLLYKKNPGMIVHFLKGVFDGLCGRLENKYQKR